MDRRWVCARIKEQRGAKRTSSSRWRRRSKRVCISFRKSLSKLGWVKAWRVTGAERLAQGTCRRARAEKDLECRADTALSESNREAESRAQRVHHRERAEEPRAGARGRRAHREGRHAAARRNSGRPQGYFRDQGVAHHL